MTQSLGMSPDAIKEGVLCPACGGMTWRWISDDLELSRTDYPRKLCVSYSACAGCGLVAKSPMPHSAALKKHYTTSWQFSTSRPYVCFRTAADWIKAKTVRSNYFGEPFDDRYTDQTQRTACDVGSKGEAIGAALKLVGIPAKWETLDPHPTKPDIASGWVGDGLKPSHAYDLVTSTHVMEHVSDPLQFVKDILGMLKPTGFAYIEVPSMEGHSTDAGSCDNINRDHLYHYTPHSLFLLTQAAGGIVRACEFDPVPRWPVIRLLISPAELVSDSSRWFMHMGANEIWSEYQKASNLIWLADNTESCLYGASHSYAYLMEHFPQRVSRMRIFDLYRDGAQIGRNVVEHPSKLIGSGIKKAYIATRCWNSYQDIASFLLQNYPGVEPLSPFENLEHF